MSPDVRDIARDAGSDGAPVRERDRCADAGDEPFGNGDRLGLVRDLLEEDRELVATEAGGGVARPDREAKALADRLQDLVPGRMPEAVVEVLEVVHVEEHDGNARGAPATQPVEDVGQSVQEQASIGEPGQGVPEGLIVDLVVQAGVLEREGRLAGEELRQLHAALAEDVRFGGRQLKDAGRFAADDQRQDDHARLADGPEVRDLVRIAHGIGEST